MIVIMIIVIIMLIIMIILTIASWLEGPCVGGRGSPS